MKAETEINNSIMGFYKKHGMYCLHKQKRGVASSMTYVSGEKEAAGRQEGWEDAE